MRRAEFIRLAAASVTALAACAKTEPEKTATSQPAESQTVQQIALAPPQPPFPVDSQYCGYRMGVQSYCFREFKTTEQLIGMMEQLGLAHIEIWPGGHLKRDLPEREIRRELNKVYDAGITVDACGVIRMPDDEAELRKIFDYAAMLNVLTISASPQYAAFDKISALTEEYNIPIAIHNHGPEDELFPTPEKIRSALANAGSKIGLCVDLGHFYRAGIDPMAVIDEFKDRVFGIHLKDLVPDENGKWEDVIVGTGKINLPVLMAKLDEIGFKGSVSLEYESDPSNPVPNMEKCLEKIREACA